MMTTRLCGLVMLVAVGLACGGDDDGGGGSGDRDGGGDDGGGGGVPDGSGDSAYDQVVGWIEDYKAEHPGNGGKDWDINAKTPEEIAGDPDAQQLLALCGDYQELRPVIPLLAWEYGGADHQWIAPAESALVYCVYIPIAPSTENWAWDEGADHVTAYTYVLFPEHNPCRDEVGADTVATCIGDPTNFEILVDIASLNDGADAGLALAEASTELRLIMPDGARVHLHDDI
ncbi:MAG TPA: hypothetical protein VIG06_20565 [Kofleriaceae bacterium]|jgi:hypothetical protein